MAKGQANTTDREDALIKAAMDAGIKSPKELANFMGQMEVESAHFQHLDESFKYKSADRVIGAVESVGKYAEKHGHAAVEEATAQARSGHPEKLAEIMYGGRGGNNEPGDGFKYHGRGFVQLTGKDNYREMGKALNIDLINHPELASEPDVAAKIAVQYWQKNVHQKAPENVTAATHIINGGENGLAERKQAAARWEHALTPERLAQAQASVPLSHAAPTPQPTHIDPATPTPKSQATSSPQQPIPDETLRENQKMLIALGAKIKDDGLYGPKTEHAVKGYQAFHGLKEDGQFNAETLAAMKADMQKQGLAKETPAQKPESEPLPKEVKERLDNAEKQVRELFTREGLNYDKQHGDKFALAAAQLGAEKGINPIEFIGVDRTSGHMIIGNKENGLLNTASMLTSDVGKVDQHTAINAVQHSVQEQNQAQQQQKQEQMQQTQEHYQHKGAQR